MNKLNVKCQLSIVNQSGIAALLTIVIVGAAALIIAYSSSILGLGELEMSITDKKGDEAFYLADGCAEEALRKLKLDSNYTGETLNIGENSCIITVNNLGGSLDIESTGTIENYSKKIKINLNISGGNITINSWEELSS